VVGGCRWGEREVRRHRLRKYRVDVLNTVYMTAVFVAAVEETSIMWDVMFLCKMSSFKGVYVLCYVDYFLFITTVEQKRSSCGWYRPVWSCNQDDSK
jgi:hypothetical protein